MLRLQRVRRIQTLALEADGSAAVSCAVLLYQVHMHMGFGTDFDSGTTDGLFGLPTAALAVLHLMLFIIAYLQGIAGQRNTSVSTVSET